jgi:hypothetical protein
VSDSYPLNSGHCYSSGHVLKHWVIAWISDPGKEIHTRFNIVYLVKFYSDRA